MKWSFVSFCFLFSKIVAFTPIKPLNSKQQKWMDCIQDDNLFVIIGEGSAGTGKTLLSCQEAFQQLSKKKIKKIVMTRPIISVENEELGFLPGTMQEKMSPWIRPMYDAISEYQTSSNLMKYIQEKKVEICPLGHMRGRTFRNSILLLDEAQNTTPSQMKMLLTRIGDSSKIIINGDLSQSDLKEKNGLEDLLERLKETYCGYEMYHKGFAIVSFESKHIVRHPIVERILQIYQDS